MNRYRTDHPEDEQPLTVAERARLRELERENRELRAKAEFLGKVCMPAWRAGTRAHEMGALPVG